LRKPGVCPRHKKAWKLPQVFSLENQVSLIAITMDSTSSPRLRNPRAFLWFTRLLNETEGRMERDFYLIEKYQDQWVVSALGNKIMTCKKKKTALQAVRSATLLLHNLQAGCIHAETDCGQDAGDQAPVSLPLFCALPAFWLASLAMAPVEEMSDE
jgi:hypothetical protein